MYIAPKPTRCNRVHYATEPSNIFPFCVSDGKGEGVIGLEAKIASLGLRFMESAPRSYELLALFWSFLASRGLTLCM